MKKLTFALLLAYARILKGSGNYPLTRRLILRRIIRINTIAPGLVTRPK